MDMGSIISIVIACLMTIKFLIDKIIQLKNQQTRKRDNKELAFEALDQGIEIGDQLSKVNFQNLF